MATPRVTIRDSAGRVIEMQAAPAYTYDTAFDSYLILKNNGCDNHTLTLVLKIYLNKIVPTTINIPYLGKLTLPYADWNGTPFAIKPWSVPDFSAFQSSFIRQCAMWNDKFWLVPPASFTALDYELGGHKVHPNIYCHLYVAVVGGVASSHRTIEIINLDKSAAARQLGKRQSDLDSSDFRSDAGHYDSLDVNAHPLEFDDDAGKRQKVNHSTVAHEIGHALGLPHIGESHGAPLCQVSILANSFLPKSITSSDSFPALYKGGSASHVCYGHSGPASLGSNVMGYGSDFDSTNAQPWLDRIALHTSTKAADWKVSVKKRVLPQVN